MIEKYFSFLNQKKKFEDGKEDLIENAESNELFVRNLSYNVDEEGLKEAFMKIGKVRFTKILKKEDGSSKGSGFVAFFNVEDAKNALCESENLKIDGRQ